MSADEIRIAQLKKELADLKGQSKSKVANAAKAAKEITTLAQWYKRATKSINAESAAFLSLTRAFLINGEHAQAAKPIINQYDYGQLTPHACIEMLFQALISWEANKMMKVAIENIDANIHRGNWLVCIYGDQRPTCPEGSLQIEKSFSTYKEASGWADRRLVETFSDGYAVLTANTEATVIKVSRHDAMWRLREQVKSPVCKVTGKTSGTLSWGQGKRSTTRVMFSRG